jgi:hypothetical protein
VHVCCVSAVVDSANECAAAVCSDAVSYSVGCYLPQRSHDNDRADCPVGCVRYFCISKSAVFMQACCWPCAS